MQIDGKIIEAGDFRPLEKSEKVQKAFGKRSASATGLRTKAQLLQKRRHESVAELQAAFGDLQNPKNGQVPLSRPQSVLLHHKRESADLSASQTASKMKPLAQRLFDKDRAESRIRLGMTNEA